MGNIIGTN